MHSLYFVKIKKAENSLEARQKAYNILESNDFAREGGYFSGSKSDWFVVGGRWSGIFTDKSKVMEAIKPLLDEKQKDYDEWTLAINPHLVSEEKKKQIDELSMQMIGLPFFRDTYSSFGYDDDAIVLTKENMEKIKKEYKEVEVCVVTEDDYIDGEAVCADLLEENEGDWLVTIDYHS